jgi:glycosyltransferase involved in cell wall biosynthesis
MRILLAANASYVPPRGGATRSNLIWLDCMAAAGHRCRIVCGASGEGAELGFHRSIDVHAASDPAHRVQALREQIREFQPDWVLVSSEDLSHGLLREAQHQAGGRMVYLAHTPQFFPFGPESWNPDGEAADLVAKAAGVVSIGHHMAAYIREYLGVSAAVIHPPIYGAGPFPDFGNFAAGLVTTLNPCAVKGISILLETAARLPEIEFGVVPGWGTTARDRQALERLANVRILPNARRIDDILSRTRVLLMPSLWMEGFGLIAMEAMLRGIPVVASDAGGLVEAKRGTGYVIPVKTIARYFPEFDEHAMPRPVIEPNDSGLWVEALRELTTDGTAYERESQASRARAAEFVSGLDAGEMERYLLALPQRTGSEATHATMESLSPEKRALLLERLRHRRAGK